MPIVVGSVRYLAKQAPPFSDGAFNISRSQQLVDQLMPRCLLFNDFPDNLGRSGTVCWWETHFQVTRKISPIVGLLTDQTQSTAESDLIETKANPRSQV